MTCHSGIIGTACLGLLAVAGVGAGPATSRAAALGFRNDLDKPIVIQAATIINNTVRRGRPELVRPGKEILDPAVAPGNRIINIYDPKQPNWPLFRGTLLIGTKDQYFSIQMDVGPNGEARVKVVPLPIPVNR